jgi:putative DNA primase/helicase
LPEELSDRAQDNWEPLLAIAEYAGPEWLQRAANAARTLSNASDAAASTGNELLADIREVFESKQKPRISTADLITALLRDDEKPWATYNRGQPISPRQLAKQLAAYGIKSKTVRLGSHTTPKGYEAAQFADAFARYLGDPSDTQQRLADTSDSNCDISVPGPDAPSSDPDVLAALGLDDLSPRPKTAIADEGEDSVL